MPKNHRNDIGRQFTDRLKNADELFASIPPDGGRELPILAGVGKKGYMQHPDTVFHVFCEIVVDAGNIYCFERRIVLDSGSELKTLVDGGTVAPETPAIMANTLLVAGAQNAVPQPPDKSLLQTAFNSNLVRPELPVIHRYAKRPVHDDRFVIHQPGYDPETCILVHGDPIEPIPYVPPTAEATDSGSVDEVRRRLPPTVGEMFADFPFRDGNDLVNCLGMIFTSLLAANFTETGRPITLLDGNQKGVGKTLLGLVIGNLLDGATPHITEFTSNNEELGKRILATQRTHQQSVIFLDNARLNGGEGVNSTSLEAMAVAKSISMRILGTSRNHVQRNDYIWMLSMNGVRTTPDLASRSVVVRLAFEGDTSARSYRHVDLIGFVKQNRAAILGELFGMVEYWREQGMPLGNASHRFVHFAQVISGILDTCGFPGFLSRHAETLQSINMLSDELSSLFEATLGQAQSSNDGTILLVPERPWSSREWIDVVNSSQIRHETFSRLNNDRAKSTWIGMTFAGLLNQEFRYEVGDRSGTGRLVRRNLSGNRTGYQFVITLDTDEEIVSIE